MGNTVQVKEFGDALTEGRSDIAAQLDADLQLDPCAKLERQDFGGDTPLHLAARSGLDGMVATWLACPRDVAGASARTVACLNAKKRTVLHAACATTRERDDAAASAETERRWQLDFENANGVILAREMVAIRARGATGATFTGDEGSDDAAGEWGELVAIENDTRDATLRTVTIILKHSSCEEKVLNLIDKEGNTALHLAARSGLPRCIAALLSAGARLDIVSTIGRSPADEAHVAKLLTISGQLEARVVFATANDLLARLPPASFTHAGYMAQGLKLQEIRREKDSEIIETSSILACRFTDAEALLRAFDWKRRELVEMYLDDALGVCARAGVTISGSGMDDYGAECDDYESMAYDECEAAGGGASGVGNDVGGEEEEERCCLICAEEEEDLEEEGLKLHTLRGCTHLFCNECWRQHLTAAIERGGDGIDALACPQIDCDERVPPTFMEKMVSVHTMEKFLRFDLNSYVESNPAIKWCPHPGCGRAVLEDATNPDVLRLRGAPRSTPLEAIVARLRPSRSSVQCGVGHLFCFLCAGTAHDPCSCLLFKRWDDYVLEKTGARAQQQKSDTCFSMRNYD